MHYPARHVTGALAGGVLVLLTSLSVQAQGDFWSTLNEGRRLAAKKDYVSALNRFEYAGRLAQQDEQRIAVALYEGLVLAEQGRQHQVHAVSAFRAGLLLAPKERLPTKVPAQIEREFEGVRMRVLKELASPASAPPGKSNPPTPGSGQENFGSAMSDVQQSLDRQDYGQALMELEHAKKMVRHEEQSATVALYEGIAHGCLGQTQLTHAAYAFREGLLRAPRAKLPVRVSAAVERDFEEVRGIVLKELASRPTTPPDDKARWRSTSAMNKARESHTATLLRTGKVLVTGGMDASVALADAELYDPASATWSLTDSMSMGRYHHTATLLPSGNVLIVGGENDEQGVLSSAESYNPNTGIWASAGTMNTGRQYHTATLLPSGKVLITGGEDSSGEKLSSAEVYDPDTGLWTPTSSMSTDRIYHDAVLLQAGKPGKVLVIGGIGSSGYLSSSEVYDPDSGTWSPAPGNLPIALSDLRAIKLSSGKVLITGGEDGNTALKNAAIYAPELGTWTPCATPMSTGRTGHTVTVLSSGNVLVAGGEANDSPFPISAEVYNPITDSWVPTAKMALARARHTATLLPSGDVLISGGSSEGAPVSSAELYAP